MEEKQLRLMSYARITNQQVVSNGNIIIENIDTDIKHWLSEIYKKLGCDYPKFFKMDPLCKSGFLTAELVMSHLHLSPDEPKEDWAVVCFNSAGSLDDDRTYQATIQEADSYFPSPAVFVYTLANIVTGEIAIRHKIKGESSCYVAQKFQPGTILQAVNDVLQLTPARHVLAGWVDFDEGVCDVLLFAATLSSDPQMPLLTEPSLQDIF